MENHSVEIRTLEANLPTLSWYREEFKRLYKLVPNFSRKNLIIYDIHFITAVGKDDIRNVKNDKAGYEKTRRVVLALQQFVEAKQAEEKRIKRRTKAAKIQLAATA